MTTEQSVLFLFTIIISMGSFILSSLSLVEEREPGRASVLFLVGLAFYVVAMIVWG